MTVATADRITTLDPRIVAEAACVLCDLDGCLVSEGAPYPDARDFVAACGERFHIVSNNSSETAESLSAALARVDLSVPPERILLAGEETVRHCAGETRSVHVVARGPIRELAERLGLAGGPEAGVVLVCRDPALTLGGLNALANALRRGGDLWVANTDLTHPGRDGRIVAETGVALAALRAMLPDLAVRSLGKPSPHLLNLALARAGQRADRALFVGDNRLTDGVAAGKAGVPFVLLERRDGP